MEDHALRRADYFGRPARHSDDLYEAASIDGATSWQKFRHITLPLLKPALLLALFFRTIDALRVFDLVYVMTQGGPADATNVLQFYGYKKTFAEGMVGYGSAIAVAVFFMSLALSLVYLRAFKTSRVQGDNCHEAYHRSRAFFDCASRSIVWCRFSGSF